MNFGKIGQTNSSKIPAICFFFLFQISLAFSQNLPEFCRNFICPINFAKIQNPAVTADKLQPTPDHVPNAALLASSSASSHGRSALIGDPSAAGGTRAPWTRRRAWRSPGAPGGARYAGAAPQKLMLGRPSPPLAPPANAHPPRGPE